MSELDRYDYELPRHLIAQQPAWSRIDARLLVVDRKHNSLEHKHIRDLPEILQAGDCLVLNESKVVPARLVGYRTQTGGRWEGLFLDAQSDGFWLILGHTRGKITPGESISLLNTQGIEDLELLMVSKDSGGNWIAKPSSSESTNALLDRVGRIPLPPYIRAGEMVESDRENYQTVFARIPGSIAAPTAGLHFSNALLEKLDRQGINLVYNTLHVGLGTFRPITTETLGEHKMHAEWGTIGPQAVETIQNCRQKGGRIVAVGTTSVRLLETAASSDGVLQPFNGQTDLFIRPPYIFRAVDAMLTNFHLPRTTLLILVRTFGGDELIQRAYREAIAEQYRFYSYGDAMVIL
ncbi:MAG: tRNA preQ1(34) S-adenosylmethionine ribosyltransferase-isomerase QueA [Pirellulales bacterium]|nr:tRNA preQ1(34) S-adenosylmethionine ribosyltransferase-isomerase QueA [Pirellulales bacterium]